MNIEGPDFPHVDNKSRVSIKPLPTSLPAPAKRIPNYAPSDIRGKDDCIPSSPSEILHPPTTSFNNPIPEMVTRRAGDASHITRSNLLDLHHSKFEKLIAHLYMWYADGSDEKRARISPTSNPQCGVHVPPSPDRGIDIIVRDIPSFESKTRSNGETLTYDLFQLKQYSDTPVSAPEVQKFIGACMTFNNHLKSLEALHEEINCASVKNAYFITTSRFTKQAKREINDFNSSGSKKQNNPLSKIIPVSDIETLIFVRRIWGSSGMHLVSNIHSLGLNSISNPHLVPNYF